MKITEMLAQFIVDTDFHSIPNRAREQALRATLDTIGVMLAGSREQCSKIAAEVVRGQECRPVATVVGHDFRSSPASAALVNGVSGHALDFDDVNESMTGHPSVPLLPAILGAGEERGASGPDLITAFVIGFEVEAKLGRGVGRSHYARGWHATSTLGTVGAAAAAAKLYGLSKPQTQMALAIAASLSGGSRQNFGTMTKPLHPGYAAQHGVTAAQLAMRGFSADPNMLEAPLGFLSLFSPDNDGHPDEVVAALGAPFEILESGINVKQYPCCYGTHRALDAVLTLASQHAVEPEMVEHVAVVMPQGAAEPLIHSRPQTGLEGKFSMEYCVAAALLDAQITLDTFEDDCVRRPAAQALLRKVEMRTDDTTSTPASGHADVTLRMRDGRSLQLRVDQPRGAPSLPLNEEELNAKYHDCADRVLGAARAAIALNCIHNLEHLTSITALTNLLTRSV